MARTLGSRLVLLLLGCSTRPTPFVPSDSTHYGLCEIDAQCPAGSYCLGGVCDLDCQIDADCPLGRGCDGRGHCLAGDVAEPLAFSGHLNLPVQKLALEADQRTATFRVENDGTDRLERFHVLSTDPGITATPSSGALAPGTGVDVQLTLAPDFAGPLSDLHVLSTGGKGTVVLQCHSALVGRLEGTVTPTGPTRLAPVALAIELGPDLSGVVDGEQSLLWPVNAKVQAKDDASGFNATFSFVGLPGSDANPLFDLPLRRTVNLDGKRDASGTITGSYAETIEGFPADAGPGLIEGTFRLHRSGAATGLQPAGAPTFVPGKASPLPSDWTCNGNGCPGDPAQLGSYFFDHGFAFERWGEESKISDGLCQLANRTDPVSCFVGDLASKALAAFIARGDTSGMWDVWRAMASHALLSANDDLASVLEPAQAQYNGPATDEVVLNQAIDKLGRGLHRGEGPGGLLASGNFVVARQGAASGPSRDVAPDDAHRFPMVVSTRFLAAAELLDRMGREGEGRLATQRVAQRAAVAGLMDIAELALLPSAGLASGPDTDVSGLSANFAQVSGAFDRTRHALNPAGFTDGFIPFDYDPSNPTHDLFQQAWASAQGYLASAQQVEQQLTVSHRDFEASSAALNQALLNAASEAEVEIHDLCGQGTDPRTLVGCGSGGKIGAATDDMQAAQVAFGEALDHLVRANLKLELLQQQARSELVDQLGELNALTTDGKVIALYARHKAEEEQSAKMGGLFGAIFGAIGGFVGAIFTGNTGALTQGLAGVAEALQDVVAGADDPELAFQASFAQTDMMVQMAIGQNIIRDDILVAQIFDANTDAESAYGEISRQAALFAAAGERWKSLGSEVVQAQATLVAKDRNLGRHLDPTFRLYRDQTGMQWDSAMEVLRKWAFLATRAFEYTANASYASGGSVFAAANARQLQGYLNDLQDAYQTDQLQNGWGQGRVDVISLRRDILGIDGPVPDAVTGKPVSPAQQFRQILALPQNRDTLGNVSLKFRTSLGSGNGIFSSDVCEDRIEGLKMNLVSPSLQGDTAYISLRQVGQAELAACVGGQMVDYQLGGKSAAIPAGLNLSRAALDAPSLPASTDLFERPVSADSWVLTIDTHGEPRNRWIDPRELDDIELWVEHAARTVQQGR